MADVERWASIPDAHDYLVSDEGRVRRMLDDGTWRPLRASRNSKGYRKVCLGRSRQEYVHRLVWQAFRGVIPDDLTVDHRDDDQLNNSLANLQLLTDEQNNAKRLARKRAGTVTRFVARRVAA